MILNILDAKQPSLRKKSKPVKKIDKKIKKLIQDMEETLRAQRDPEGVGLAAPQVGKNLRIFLMKPTDDIVVIINPKVISKKKLVTKTKKEPKILEGCLSLPHFYGPLIRDPEITIEYLDIKGNKLRKTFNDFEAQLIQHEIDHLNGVLFVDILLKEGKPLYEYNDGEWERVEL